MSDLALWTSWTTRFEQNNEMTDVSYEQPLEMISDIATDGNNFTLVRETTGTGGGSVDGEGVVHVDENFVLNEPQPISSDEMICEQHQGEPIFKNTHNSGTDTSQAIALMRGAPGGR